MIEGKVVHGNHLGRTMGFPTANICVLGDLCLPDIVSVCEITIDTEVFDGVGTYLPSKGVYEVHIFDFDQDIYGKTIQVIVKDTIRSNQRFTSLEDLAGQIQKDVQYAKELLNISR